MFRGKPEVAESATPADPSPAPVEKRPARESRIFNGGATFAARKAEAQGLREPRIVSLGKSEFTQRDRRTGEVNVIGAELFCDIDKPMNRYAELDGHPGRYPLRDSSGGEDQVTPLPGRFKARGRGPSGLSPTAAIEAPPYPV